jgi:Ni/Fe-hydrogenase subunit HybB-like protein
VRRVKRLLQLTVGLIAFLAYVWFAAVRMLPLVKRRKARRSSRAA